MVPLRQSMGLCLIGGDGRLDLCAVGVIVGQGRMDVGQCQVTKLVDDFLGAKAQLVPADDALHCDACSSDMWPPPADVRGADNQRPYRYYGLCHVTPVASSRSCEDEGAPLIF